MTLSIFRETFRYDYTMLLYLLGIFFLGFDNDGFDIVIIYVGE